MARTAGTFGTTEQLKSGQWRARYRHGGKRWTAPEPFATEDLARGYLASVRYAIDTDTWVPPHKSEPARPDRPRAVPTFKDFAEEWVTKRLNGEVGSRPMRQTTAADYRLLLGRALYPTFGRRSLDTITPENVTAWYRRRLELKRPADTASAYSLMKTIMKYAIRCEHISVTPCQLDGAGTKTPKHTPVILTPDEVTHLADEVGDRFRFAVILGAWCALRFGEIAALKRRDIDVKNLTISVERGAIRVTGERVKASATKTRAGVRTVAIPPHVADEVRRHLARIPDGPDALLFASATDPGVPIAASTFYRKWNPARKAVGQPTVKFHDLRHTGATMAGRAGASIAELQARLGHTTPNAAMRYQHATRARDRALADAISAMVASPPKLSVVESA
ncbi:tyrosine-type recombinase/integrase [Gordonia polyisoprenivorans]|uniref:tyrosine-type recombinase/integrase n=1 Tax=Gordonia polyisoprenivorans TaxID=84595 RepID=UPI001AD76209|nr:site-specific integrase [Gordonia polyisoprenivorans]QTI67660.1 site-specific integrase [Gordonia polyisoprenivorans]